MAAATVLKARQFVTGLGEVGVDPVRGDLAALVRASLRGNAQDYRSGMTDRQVSKAVLVTG
ncbi:MAG TPA: hypothetical protein VMQ81_07725, partial [Acidimicrobiia bacterium]|nr:hypothetical protein [Acidimicrobiia bacterium]